CHISVQLQQILCVFCDSAIQSHDPASLTASLRRQDGRNKCVLDDYNDSEASCSQLKPEPAPSSTNGQANGDAARHGWTDAMREALVVSIRQRNVLWDRYHPLANNSSLRTRLWGEVSQEMLDQFGILFSVNELRRVWKNLRHSYRSVRETKKKPLKESRCVIYLVPMSFLECDITAERTTESDHDSERSSSPEGLETLSSGYATLLYCKPDDRRQGRRKDVNIGICSKVSVPQIDCLLKTKQGVSQAPSRKFYPIDFENVEDNLSAELEKVYDKMDTAREQVKKRLDLERKLAELDASIPQYEVDDLKKKYGDMLSPGEIVLLKRLAGANSCPLKEATCEAIFFASLKLRKLYHRAALSLFIKESLPSGQLQALTDAYDDFVYSQKPKDPLILKVVESCDAESKESFTMFFSVIEKFASMLNLRRPEEPRLPRDEFQERKVDEFCQGRKKKRPSLDMEYLAREESRRITNARAAVAKKIEKIEADVQSTMSLLEVMVPVSSEGRVALEKKLKAAEEAYERALKEQRQVEMEYEEFQSRNNRPPPKRPKTKKNSSAKTSKGSAALEQSTLSSSTTELFDNDFKPEA
ncbi:hypothetical protein COOONC_07343, partial [Cooperia oncophora]